MAALDLKGAAYLRRYALGGGDRVQLRTYAHRSRQSLLVVELTATCNASESVNVSLGGGAGVLPIGVDFAWQPAVHTTVGDHKVLVWNGTTREAEADPVQPHQGVHQGTVQVAVVIPASTGTVTLRNATSTVMLAAVRTSLESTDPVAAALADYARGIQASPADLLKEHTEAWAMLWESGFEVKGRHDVAATVNSSLYYLLSSVREDRPNSLSPGGLASNGYNGHSFWDCETWMYPSLL